jgi:hypothetical protein
MHKTLSIDGSKYSGSEKTFADCRNACLLCGSFTFQFEVADVNTYVFFIADFMFKHLDGIGNCCDYTYRADVHKVLCRTYAAFGIASIIIGMNFFGFRWVSWIMVILLIFMISKLLRCCLLPCSVSFDALQKHVCCVNEAIFCSQGYIINPASLCGWEAMKMKTLRILYV